MSQKMVASRGCSAGNKTADGADRSLSTAKKNLLSNETRECISAPVNHHRPPTPTPTAQVQQPTGMKRGVGAAAWPRTTSASLEALTQVSQINFDLYKLDATRPGIPRYLCTSHSLLSPAPLSTARPAGRPSTHLTWCCPRQTSTVPGDGPRPLRRPLLRWAKSHHITS